MRHGGSVLVLVVLSLAFVLPGCAETSQQRLITAHDHPRLANYYSDQAQELREKAKYWEFMAEFYEQHPEQEAKADAAQHAAHCRTIAQSYRKAAEEAEALAAEHRRQRPHGMVQ